MPLPPSNSESGDFGGIASDRLRHFVERIERLEEERRTLGGDIKEVYAEAKGNGFDVKIMRRLIRERRMDQDDRDEAESLFEVYWTAIMGGLTHRDQEEEGE